MPNYTAILDNIDRLLNEGEDLLEEAENRIFTPVESNEYSIWLEQVYALLRSLGSEIASPYFNMLNKREIHLLSEDSVAQVTAVLNAIGVHIECTMDTEEYVQMTGDETGREFAKSIKEMRVFVVHGHDKTAAIELKDYLQNKLKMPEPVLLFQQASSGRTIIEKFEDSSDKIDVAFVLMTPDDTNLKSDGSTTQRARQNVLFELGYFVAKFGRKSGRVFLLKKGNVEVPSDLSGVIYVDISAGIESASEQIRTELQAILK